MADAILHLNSAFVVEALFHTFSSLVVAIMFYDLSTQQHMHRYSTGYIVMAKILWHAGVHISVHYITGGPA